MTAVPDPFHFAARFLESAGALVEPHSRGAFALLPGELARHLGWDTEVELRDREEEGGTLIAYGSGALEGLLGFAQAQGAVCRVRAAVSMPGFRDLAGAARAHYRFRTPVRVRFGEQEPHTGRYLIVHYSLLATSEDACEDCFPVVVNETTLSPVGDRLADLLTNEAQVMAAAGAPSPPGGRTIAQAEREAHRRAATLLEPFARTMERRRQRDLEHLWTYYESLAREAQARKGRGRANAGDRLRAFQSELERKVRDLDVRYGIRVRLRPALAARLEVPVIRGTYLLQWKDAERQVPVVWNPVLGGFEPVPCDTCGAGVVEAVVEKSLRVVCGRCAGPGEPGVAGPYS